MMRRVLLWLLFIPAIAVGSSKYLWNKKSSEIINNSTVDFTDSYAATSWGGCNTEVDDLRKSVRSFQTKISKNFKDELGVKIFLHRDALYVERDLVIQLPGIFGKVDDKGVKFLSHKIANKGNNVIVVPNPLSTSFVKARARGVEMGNLLEEGAFYYEMVKDIIEREISKRRIKIRNINLVGVSYGAFLASVINGIDSEKDKIINKVTLFSPPINMGAALENIDSDLDSIDNLYSSSPLAVYVTGIYKVCKASSDRFFTRDLFNVAKIMTLHIAFHANLVDTIKQYNRNYGNDLIPDADGSIFSSRYRRWKKKLRFRNLLNNHFNRSQNFIASDSANIEHHFQKSFKNRGYSNVKILGAENDFLNVGMFWHEDTPADNREIRFGGHLGYTATGWFSSLVNSAFYTGIKSADSCSDCEVPHAIFLEPVEVDTQ